MRSAIVKIVTTVHYASGDLLITNTTTRWYNSDPHGPHTIKSTVRYAYSGGTPAQGALTSSGEELKSYR